MTLQKQILIVDDDPVNRADLRTILTPEYRVLETENGAQALGVLRERPDEIALILLDLVLPGMDGCAFLAQAKAEQALASIPVIVTTRQDSEAAEIAALSGGAADFVVKPYRPQVILHRIANIIRLRETSAMIRQVQYDRLTGLYSKEFFYQQVKQLLLLHPEQEYDIICSDIENFKLINDMFGVPTGDCLLRGVAELYTGLVGDQGICGHFNADRFACLLKRQACYTDTLFLRFGAQVNTLSNAKNVIMKWGIYPVTDRTLPVEHMCDRALLAARSIRGQYGKHFARYDDALRSPLLREQAITDSMEAALAQDQFQIYLQPKYNIKDDRLAGAEALVRWQHPEWGLLLPSEFIPLFEKNGFITKLDQYVWNKVCSVLQAWSGAGGVPLSISVNVSRADVYQADLIELLTATLEAYGLPASSLHLEITESAYTEHPDQLVATVRRLRELGFVIEMDDFGSGYSSLNMLNQMPLDILKLDMKFIQSETAKPVDQGILRFIMDLARWMNLSVVAEGVETRAQLERLQEIGCDYVQGYYFAKPMPCSAFEALLRNQQEAPPPAAASAAPSERRTQILLVADEDAAYRSQVRKTFGESYHVIEAADGHTAMGCIAHREQQIAAVVLSLTLPRAEGFSVLEVLQREKAVWKIPVVATAPGDARLEERALEQGADDFAAKPHTQRSLWKRVMRAMGVTSSRERERALEDAACRDYLTGLLNRRGLHTAALALRREDLPAAVYMFDLDNLKQINDTFGHAEGDRILKRFASVLRRQTRGSDILVRLGGDEFVVVMKQMPSPETALKKGCSICRAFRQEEGCGPFPASCSAGAVICTRAETLTAETLAYADEALYRAKSNQKGGCCLWTGTHA